jgi:hypothetical protein
MNRNARFSFEPFDTKAAIEAAEMYRELKAKGDWRGGSTDDKQTVKVDQQIVAIGRSLGANPIYTSDTGMVAICKALKVPCVAVWELPLPPEKQQELEFSGGEETKPTPEPTQPETPVATSATPEAAASASPSSTPLPSPSPSEPKQPS